MPTTLKAIYLGAAGLAVIACFLGIYDFLIAGKEGSSFGSDVFLPLAVLAIIVVLYLRRKRDMEEKRRERP